MEMLEPRTLFACGTGFAFADDGHNDINSAIDLGVLTQEVVVEDTITNAFFTNSGGTTSEQDNRSTDIDVYSFAGTAGMQVAVTFEQHPNASSVPLASGGGADAHVRFIDSQGNILNQATGTSSVNLISPTRQFTVPADGTYYIAFTGFSQLFNPTTGCVISGGEETLFTYIKSRNEDRYQLRITPSLPAAPPTVDFITLDPFFDEGGPDEDRATVGLGQLIVNNIDQPLIIEVVYTDPQGVDESQLSSTSLIIDLPDATSRTAVFNSVVNSNGADNTTETVRYALNPPAGGWSGTNVGTYNAFVNGVNAPRDTNGTAMAGDTFVASFEVVSGDLTAEIVKLIPHINEGTPQAQPTRIDITELTENPTVAIFFVEVAYEDPDSIDESNLSFTQIQLVGTTNGKVLTSASAGNQTGGGDNLREVIQYRVPAPAGGWTEDFVDTYEVRTAGQTVMDVTGQQLPNGTLVGEVAISDGLLSVDLLGDDSFELKEVHGKSDPILFRVRYKDADGLDVASIPAADVLLIESLSGELVSELTYLNTIVEDANTAVREYQLEAPAGGGWNADLLGDYSVQTGLVTAEDVNGDPGPQFDLAGLFSVVDNDAPEFTSRAADPNVTISNTGELPTQVLFTIDWADIGRVDLASTEQDRNIVAVRESDQMSVALRSLGSQVSDGIRTMIASTYIFSPQVGGVFSEADEGVWRLQTGSDTVKDDSGNAVAPGQPILVNDEQLTITIDLTPPTGSVPDRPPTPAANAPLIVFVDLTDNVSGIDPSQIVDDLFVVQKTGGATLPPPRVVSIFPMDDDKRVLISMEIDAPDGSWDNNDQGNYTIRISGDGGSGFLEDKVGNKTFASASEGLATFNFFTGTFATTGPTGGTITLATLEGEIKGKIVEVAIKEGLAELQVLGDNVQESEGKKGPTLAGALGNIASFLVGSQSSKASVKLKQKGKGDRVIIDQFTATGPFSKIDLKVADIGQNVDVSGGTTKKFIAGNVMDDHLIEIGPPEAGIEAIDIVLDRVSNTDLVSLTPIKSLTVTEWIDDDGDPDQIIAPWIGKIIVKGNKKENIAGDFEADLILSGVDAPKGVALGSATIPGSLREAVWDLGGASGAITVKTDVSDVTIDADGGIKSLKLGDVSNTNVTATDEIKSIQAARWLDGDVVAPQVSALKIAGDRKRNIPGDSSLDLVLDGLDNGKPRLGSTKIAGSLLASAWAVYGDGKGVSVTDAVTPGFVASFGGELKSFAAKGAFDGLLGALTLGSFSALSMTGANVHVGTSAGADGVLGNGDDMVQFALLKSIKVKDGVANTLITVGVASRNDTFFDGDDDFAGGEIKSITLGDLDNDSIFATGLFPKTVKVGKTKVDPTLDARFVTLVFEP